MSGRLGRRLGAGLGSFALRPYGAALVAIALAILVRRLGDPRLGTEQLPYGSMLVAAMIVVWRAGLRPALVVVYFGGAAANFFLLAPRMSFAPGPAHQGWGLVAFLVLGTAISMVGGFAHLQRARTEAAAKTRQTTESALRDAHDGVEHRSRDRIAELVRLNESLRVSEERFRLLVEGMRGYAIFMVDRTGAIVGWNRGAERMFERSADIVGDSIAALIPGLQAAALPDAIGHGTAELEAVRPGGVVFPIELAITPLEPSGLLVGIVHDISERKRLEAETERKQRRADELRRKTEEIEADSRRMQDWARLQSQFLANMSHELRTPLNAIIGFSEMLHGGAAGAIEDQHREFLGDILTSGRHLLQLINNALELAKAESGALEVAPQPLDLAGVIAEIGDLVRDLAARRHIEIELDLATGLGCVTADPTKLRQILYNYVSNALKFTPEGGRVTIRATPIDQGFRIEVEDTGIGIASEDLRYLFVAFRQLDASATKRYPGTGLGLALTKRLAEAHGGTVGVRSVRGVGSTFWVELPRQTVPGPGLRIATPASGTKALG